MGVSYSDLRPSETTDYYWIGDRVFREEDEKAVDIGKWMLFYPRDKIDGEWELAKNLYRSNKLEGVTHMKCSTAKKNPRASSDNFVIILYCTNSGDSARILSIGRHIVQVFDYKNPMYYKTNTQTQDGTRGTGQQYNHTYVIEPRPRRLLPQHRSAKGFTPCVS